MKHELIVTPLNCGYGTGLNNIATFYEDEYNSKIDRAVLFYEPNMSKFKLKAIHDSLFPYIEPSFIGLNPTDIIEIELEAMKVGNTDTCLRIDLLEITENNSTSTRTIEHELSISNDFYKIIRVRCSLEGFTNSMKGLIFNFRNKVSGTELMIKNVKINVYTSNSDFEIREDYIYINKKEDFVNTILAANRNVVQGSSKIYGSYRNGIVEVTDDGELNCVSDSSDFKGLCLTLGKKKTPTKIAVYLEYKNTVANSLRVNSFFTSTPDTSKSIYLSQEDEWKRKVIYLDNLLSSNKNELLNLEIGTSVSTARFSLRNIIIGNSDNNRENNSLYKYLNIDNQNPNYLNNIALCKKYLIQKDSNVTGGWVLLNDYTQDTITFTQIADTVLQCKYSNGINSYYDYKCVAIAQITSDNANNINVRLSACKNGMLNMKFFDSSGNEVLLANIPDGTYINLLIIL